MHKSKNLWREIEERSEFGNEQLLAVSQYSGITPREEDSRSESLVAYKKCQPNDLVINIMLAWLGGLGVTKQDGIVSPAYCVFIARHKTTIPLTWGICIVHRFIWLSLPDALRVLYLHVGECILKTLDKC